MTRGGILRLGQNRAMTRVPYTGTEKASLVASLDKHRDAILWKLEGLDDEALRRPMTPLGTSLLGIVKHLATTAAPNLARRFPPILARHRDQAGH